MQKMNGRKKYEGEKYSFDKKKRRLGKGGNGAVYDVEVEGLEYPVVAKFFEYEGYDKEIRYKRFKNEIHFACNMSIVDGIMPILDKKCPQSIPKRKDEAWFLMPKAIPYKVNMRNKIIDKLDDMLRLAHIIENIHRRKYAHRDIKPENILMLNGKLMLSDYGLVWESDEDRITEANDRIGPYRILPPELEHVLIESVIDFMPADVYLFAKVLWMTIKEDNIGFRGQYNRGDSQIYLKKEKYRASTLEPLHKLLEESTYEEPDRRITIEKCIEYLKVQKRIFAGDIDVQLPEEKIKQFQYDEYSKEVISKNVPNEFVYEEKQIIYGMLRDVIPVADIYIKGLGDVANGKRMQISSFEVISDRLCRLSYYYAGKRIKEYQLNIKKMTYSKRTEDITLELENLDMIEEGCVSFGESIGDIGNVFSKIYLTPDESIIIKKMRIYAD